MDSRKKALLIALVLGDGYIKIDRRAGKTGSNPSLKLCHSLPQKKYLEYKAKLLHNLLGGKEPKINKYFHNLNGRLFEQYRCEKAHRYFRVLHNWMYPNKKYQRNLLNFLTPEALAIWYMDDGSCISNNRHPDGTTSSSRTNIHTCCRKEEADIVSQYFKEVWDISFKPFKEKENYSVRCFHKEGRKFHEIIRPYIIPSMQYKQRFYYGTSA